MWIVVHRHGLQAIGPFETYNDAVAYRLADDDGKHLSVVRMDAPETDWRKFERIKALLNSK